MFKWLNKQGVESSKGFIVQSVARFVIEYREAGKCLSIETGNSYFSGGKLYETVKLSNFNKWDDGFSISSETQKEIIQNFTDAMVFQGIKVIVIT